MRIKSPAVEHILPPLINEAIHSSSMEEVISFLARERDRHHGRAAAFAKAIRWVTSLEAESRAETKSEVHGETNETKNTPPKAAPDPVVPTVSEVVRAAVMAQSTNFKSLDVRAYIDQRHPELARTITSDRISTSLYYLRKNGAIILVAKGTKGGAHTYRVSPSPKTK